MLAASVGKMLQKKADLVAAHPAMRNLGDDRENLNGHIAFDEARHINLATLGALDKIAAPQKRIGMQIGN